MNRITTASTHSAAKNSSKSVFSSWLKAQKLNTELVGVNYEYAAGVICHLPIYYSHYHLGNPPRLLVAMASTYGGGNKPYKCLHIWVDTAQKWIPLPQTKIFTAGKTTPKKKVLAALRLLVKPQIDDFRNMVEMPHVCILTGKLLTNFTDCHVDHYNKSFMTIVEEFLLSTGHTFDTIALGRNGLLKDPRLSQAFYAYHKRTADFQLVDKTANLKKGRKKPSEL